MKMLLVLFVTCSFCYFLYGVLCYVKKETLQDPRHAIFGGLAFFVITWIAHGFIIALMSILTVAILTLMYISNKHKVVFAGSLAGVLATIAVTISSLNALTTLTSSDHPDIRPSTSYHQAQTRACSQFLGSRLKRHVKTDVLVVFDKIADDSYIDQFTAGLEDGLDSSGISVVYEKTSTNSLDAIDDLQNSINATSMNSTEEAKNSVGSSVLMENILERRLLNASYYSPPEKGQMKPAIFKGPRKNYKKSNLLRNILVPLAVYPQCKLVILTMPVPESFFEEYLDRIDEAEDVNKIMADFPKFVLFNSNLKNIDELMSRGLVLFLIKNNPVSVVFNESDTKNWDPEKIFSQKYIFFDRTNLNTIKSNRRT